MCLKYKSLQNIINGSDWDFETMRLGDFEAGIIINTRHVGGDIENDEYRSETEIFKKSR